MFFNLDCDPNNVFFRCVEDSSEAIMITDAEGKLLYVNPAWVSIYGFTKEEAIGKTPRLLHSGHHDDSFYRKMWEDILTPKISHWKGEVLNRTKDGKIVPVFLTITPFRGPSGEVFGYMGLALDITQKKELEAKVVHQDRLASIGMLASGLAHEVGTPLGVIRGRAEFMMMQAKASSMKKSLEIIVAQIDRISKLLQSLLRISRSTSDVRFDAVSLAEVIAEVGNLVAKDLRQFSIESRVSVSSELRVLADFNRLEQVILNFVMNSIFAIREAADGGGGAGGPHLLAFDASRTGRKIALKVSDTGCGIAPENMKKLFQPFFTTKPVGEGTGLGLAIVAQLVNEMGGEISVESSVGAGTTFTVILDSA